MTLLTLVRLEADARHHLSRTVTSPLHIRVATAEDREALRRLNERLRSGL